MMLPAHLINILAVEELERREEMRLYNMDRRIMRDTSNPFTLSDIEFTQLFRLNKDMAQYCLNRIMPHVQEGSITPVIKYFATLHFYATGSYQKVSGQNFNISLSQQAMSKIITTVTNAIITELSADHLKFPFTWEEKNVLKQGFMDVANFPGVIGAVDGTHVAMLRPPIQEHNYLNRKGYHSKNVQIVCDFKLKILNVNAQYGGSTHDAFIWAMSRVKGEMERCYHERDRNTWLIGDSGYPQQPWLMTPIENALPETPENAYNIAHIRTRNCVERCIGVLKNRFRCLLLERKLRYSPQKTSYIIMACAILHNICIDGQLPIDFDLPPLPPDVLHDPIDRDDQQFIYQEGLAARANVVALYFN